MWEGEQKEDYYVTKFETPFLRLSEAHFLSRSTHWITSYSCEGYLTNVKNALELEERNADQWLLARSKPLIIDLSVKLYVTDMAQDVINKEDGVEKFFLRLDLEKLRLLYLVFQYDSANTFQLIVEQMQSYIQ